MSKKLSTDGTKNLCGKRIKKLRTANSLSQEDLMEQLQLLGFDRWRNGLLGLKAGYNHFVGY